MMDQKHLLGITVNQHIIETQRSEAPGATGEFSLLLQEIIVAAKVIRDKITLAGIAEVLGHTGDKNVQGETVAILDELSNKIMIRRLLKSGLVSMIISEENEEPFYNEENPSAKYVVAVDPCDGSSNIACNVPVGTIFGIWKRKSGRDERPNLQDGLQTGRELVCGGYVLYGPSSMFVYTTGQGVHGFTYDPSIGEFILTHENMKFPSSPKCYSVNECYWAFWDERVKKYVEWIKDPNVKGHPISARYVGSLVSDFHRNLLYGGVFFYPLDVRSNSGKLRLLYECAPLSFIAESAGGKGSTGSENVLDIQPSNIHQRIPLYIGNKNEVEIAEEFLNGSR